MLVLSKIREALSGPEPPKDNSLIETKYVASMVLAGVGDAMGYNNGQWEFCKQETRIHEELQKLGGLDHLRITGMSVSDDQVMHLASAEALIEYFAKDPQITNIKEFFPILAKHYIKSFSDMSGRAPGPTTSISIGMLENNAEWNQIPFNKRAGGCGGAMRAMCFGLVFYGEAQRSNLISVAIESGRITHNQPTGFFGALASAVFTAFAVERVPIVEWGRKLINEILPKAYEYLQNDGRDWDKYHDSLKYFEIKWRNYLETRKILESETTPTFPIPFGVVERDKFYKDISFDGWGGSSGHDAPMIAYDALLGAGDNWHELVYRGVLHGGDNDSTGCIAAALWGAIYGFQGVPEVNYRFVEYRDRATEAAHKLRTISTTIPH
eukprot:Phypoly_transcript_08975.p1 GENE.Phypoly_transcript_08975~~Phypoly_transcript_08975.p1  ORF type:complete len:381 (+),score=48.29 Phypoly_transcript_08975:242-1384(+)